jgi:hypothetical protein
MEVPRPILIVDDELKIPKEEKSTQAPPQPLPPERKGGVAAVKVGDEVNFGGLSFRIHSFGRSMMILHAQNGTHLVERKR